MKTKEEREEEIEEARSRLVEATHDRDVLLDKAARYDEIVTHYREEYDRLLNTP